MPIGKTVDSGGPVLKKTTPVAPTKTATSTTPAKTNTVASKTATPAKKTDEKTPAAATNNKKATTENTTAPKAAVNNSKTTPAATKVAEKKPDPKANILDAKGALKNTRPMLKDTKQAAIDNSNSKAINDLKANLKTVPSKEVVKATAPKSTTANNNNSESNQGNIFGVNLKSVPNNKIKIPILSDDEDDSDEYEYEEVEEEETESEEEVSETETETEEEEDDDGEEESDEEAAFKKELEKWERKKKEKEEAEKKPVRTNFRPPWVKEKDTKPQQQQTKAWQLTKRNSKDKIKGKDDEDEPHTPAFQMPQLRKVSQGKITPIQENGAPKEPIFVKPQLKPVPPKEMKLQSKEVKIPIKLNPLQERLEREETRRQSLTKQLTEEDNLEKAIPSVRNALVKQESLKKVPKAPPMPPPAPAMPPPFGKKELSEDKLKALENLRARPKTRPDWTAMLKDIEGGRKLKHVTCNDRSQPLIPEANVKGKFLYESEKANAHNDLLKEIQQGRHLKKVKTNDRSKPVLEGLRKFRRQMTIEEQIIKSQSMASIPPEEVLPDEADEMDDIDKVRDDLQSTKQLLAIELRNKEAVERENKKMQARIQHLEAELAKEKLTQAESGKAPPPKDDDDFFANPDGFIIKSLKDEMEEARKQSAEVERKFSLTAEQLDFAKSQIDDLKKAKEELEKKLKEVLQGKRLSTSNTGTNLNGDSEEENFYEDDPIESDGEDTEEKREKRAQREVKMLRNKLRSFKTKEENAKKERQIIKDLLKKSQAEMKEEKKKFKELQKEVNKMAALMKESDDEEEEEEPEEKEESESESESSESESSDDENSDSEKSQSEDEEAPLEKKKDNLTHRTKRHESILNALKKGNYVLKTNVERLQDDLNKQKEATATLQEDLNSVLSELG